MLAIRMQRTGRSGHAQFRVIVQDSHFHPTRGKVVAYVGNYNPHTKDISLDKDVISKYLGSGAQPSPRVASLLKKEGVKLPDWVKIEAPKKRSIKNTDKLRKNRPAAPIAETPAEAAPGVAEEPEAGNQPEAPVEAEQPVVEEPTIEEVPSEAETVVETTPAEIAEAEEPAKPKA